MTLDYIAGTMPLTSAETPIAVAAQPMPLPQESAHGDARSAATDFLQIESIVLNLDASLRVHARAHFFSWTQGLLQSLIRHELLICTLCHGKPPAFRADGFSMTAPDPSTFSDLFLRDTAAPSVTVATTGSMQDCSSVPGPGGVRSSDCGSLLGCKAKTG